MTLDTTNPTVNVKYDSLNGSVVNFSFNYGWPKQILVEQFLEIKSFRDIRLGVKDAEERLLVRIHFSVLLRSRLGA